MAPALRLASSSFLLHKHRLLYSSSISKLKLHSSSTSIPKLPTLEKSYEPQRLILYFDNLKEKFVSFTPQPLKDFPFQDVAVVFLQQLLLAGKKALKLSLLVVYICTFITDVAYSISRNKEWMVPLGMFVGYIATNLNTEASKVLFPFLEENDIRQHVVGSSCLFALVKIISTYFLSRRKIFLLHVANGGLMQVIWLWKNYQIIKQDMKDVNA